MRLWLARFAALLLTACAVQPDLPATDRLGPPLESFVVEGRLSLRQGERSDHLQFDWRHAPGSDVVLFSSPLGQGLAELGREANGAWLKLPGKPEQRAPDLPSLTQKLFGAPLPLEVLAEWMGGRRAEMHGEVDGWIVTVSESSPYLERRLPKRIEIRRDEIELKLVVTGWSAND
jgi:outer membrane lipoprotein LolB